jgi:hypothetical protein
LNQFYIVFELILHHLAPDVYRERVVCLQRPAGIDRARETGVERIGHVHKATFEPVPKSAMAARRFVADCLAPGGDHDIALVVLLANELATNAIVHSRLTFEVTVDLTATCVKISVDDLSAVLPVVGRPSDEGTGGRGLAMIAAIADRWGIEPTPAGKRTWFELCAGGMVASGPRCK